MCAMEANDVRCQRCNHPFANHRTNCRWRRVGHYNKQTQTWDTEEACTCEAYVGIHPRDLNDCPHETVSTDPTFCVHCLKHIPVRKR